MDLLITSFEQLTPEYLTDLFRRSGILDRGEVIKVTKKLTKKLHVSVVSRLEVGYSADSPASVPRNLFLKVSTPDLPKVVSSGRGKEVEFYNSVAPEMDEPPFIRCYDAAFSPETSEYYLLMEDLSETHSQPKSPLPPSIEQSEAAVECLARLHAFWRDHPKLGNGIGTVFDDAWLSDFVDTLEKNVTAFMDFLGDKLTSERRRIYDRMLASKLKIWGRLTDAAGLTVTHGDAHWWNFLYPLDPANDCVRLFDWQLWHLDLGARDLAFVLALGGFSERRPNLESHLTRHYHNTLISHGVTNYAWDDFWTDYRFSAIRNLNIPVIQWSQGRSEHMWLSNLERAMSAYEDLGCSKLLDH